MSSASFKVCFYTLASSSLTSRATLAIHILILFLVCYKNTFFAIFSFFGVFSESLKFCFGRSLTAVDRKMQILSASFEVLFQQVFNCCV